MHQNFKSYLLRKGGLTPAEYEQITSYIRAKKIKKGSYLLREGEICTLTFFVEAGLLRLYRLDEAGKEHILQFASESWLVSDRGSVYFKAPSKCYIDAIEDSTVILLDEEFFTQINAVSKGFRKYNERLLQNHIRHLNDRINRLLSASAKERYLAFIRLYPDVLLRVPQWMVASYLGIKPESLSRVRKDLASSHQKPT